MVLINGKKTSQIEIADRGFQYGDGLFETIKVKNGVPLFLCKHLERLIRDCKKLSIPFEDKALLKHEISVLIQEYGRNGVLKIILSRGIGGRGYRPLGKPLPTRALSIHPNPVYPESFERQGVKVILCRNRLSSNTTLAGIKHLNRLEQILASREWNDCDAQEGLMVDQANRIVEGTKSNLFIVKHGIIYTPEIDNCGVAGVVRSIVMESALEHGLEIKETRIRVEDVASADELFLTNSVIIIWPVKQFLEKVIGVGPVTQRIQNWLFKTIELEIGK